MQPMQRGDCDGPNIEIAALTGSFSSGISFLPHLICCAAAEAVGGPLQYFCGTKYGGATGGTFLPYHSIYPLDKSPGVLVDGR